MHILVALSGGVDSACAAWLLKQQGHAVTGVYMRTWMDEAHPLADCPWKEDLESARQVSETLHIELRVLNMIDIYQQRVVDYLVDGYQKGYTPNPDIMCNREVKFGVLMDYAQSHGFEALATGHYCRRRENQDGSYDLLEGLDETKDQSYFLSLITQKALRFARFPIGDFHKSQVRQMALEAMLPNAQRKDSQGICFLGKVKIQDFLSQYILDCPGEIIDINGRVLGQHRGLHRYTLGQRRGIGIPSNTDHQNFVVISKNIAQNQLIVAFDQPDTPGLYTRCAYIYGINWLNKPLKQATAVWARPRYRDPAYPAWFEPIDESAAQITFEQPQRALAPGQIMALYEPDRTGVLLGGGFYG